MSNITSQSELTTKEIVEQAISDYHESILPYLNGMVPTIANKFDKANLYSEDEQIVGRWIDGKPLYQKTITGKTPSSTAETTIYTGNTNDRIINIDGYIKNAELNYYDNGNWRTKTSISTNRIVMQVYGFTDLNYSITLQYTKTTDEAIAIGSDTDYSLEEKIVGTWIDGKPLYQKTIANINISTTWNSQVCRGEGSYTNASVGALNIDTIVFGSIITPTKGCNYARCSLTATNTIVIILPANDDTIKDLTIQYTKTTDV